MKLEYIIIGILLLSILSFAQAPQEFLQPQKVIILSLKFEKNVLLVEDSLVQYGSPPNRLPRENVLQFKIISDKGNILDSYEIGDPRFVYDIGYVDNVSFNVVMPYIRSSTKIEVFDKNQSIGSIDLSESFGAFCRTKNDICDLDCKEDVDCPAKKTEPVKPPADYSYLIIFAAVMLSIILFYSYRKLREMKILKVVRRVRHR